MKNNNFWFKDKDNVDIFVYRWLPDGKPKAIVQIAHGAAEHGARYSHVGKAFTTAGYAVYANDHRGHGKTGQKFGKLGDLGPGGWDSTVHVLKELTDIIKKEQLNIPLFLLGHSWGAGLTKDYLRRWGKELNGVILTGTSGLPSRRVNSKAQDRNLNVLIKNPKTSFDWLTRDENEVQKYINDPLCGFLFTDNNSLVRQSLRDAYKKLYDSKYDADIPKDLPIYAFVGSEDSIGGERGIQALTEHYKKVGIKDISYKVYSGGRHEMFNEINRDEVILDVLYWLETHI